MRAGLLCLEGLALHVKAVPREMTKLPTFWRSWASETARRVADAYFSNRRVWDIQLTPRLAEEAFRSEGRGRVILFVPQDRGKPPGMLVISRVSVGV
jgi:hypothetical protein